METNTYKTFFTMLLISFCIMYGVMFLNVDSGEHIYLSATRFYMSVLMITPMGILMIAFMRIMYKNKKLNAIILMTSIALFILAFAGLRTQSFISDKQYIRAMIPHHSSAIMTSKHANLKDPEVKELAASIIKSQEKEIEQMKQMLERMNK